MVYGINLLIRLQRSPANLVIPPQFDDLTVKIASVLESQEEEVEEVEALDQSGAPQTSVQASMYHNLK